MSEELIQKVSQTVMNDVEDLENPQGVAMVTFGDGAIPSIHSAEGTDVQTQDLVISINALLEMALQKTTAPESVVNQLRSRVSSNIEDPPVELTGENPDVEEMKVNEGTEQGRYPFRWGDETVEIVASEGTAEEILNALREAQQTDGGETQQ
ncbi:hypothetical protein [Haloplanus natans]|uniref:hypothetical protein n=1 Tax=Haloplanus natans TaxID=376171 RepID=UPI0006781D95|nr:hypothetical protein [Haloplanus natans]